MKAAASVVVGALAGVAVAGHPRASAPPSCRAPYTWQSNLALDEDGDGYTVGSVTRACVGEAFPEKLTPFRHYRSQDGRQYIDIATARGSGDCDDDPGAVGFETFRFVLGGSDPDHTGRVAGIGLACVGVESFINGRHYYTRGGGDQSTWLDARDIVAVDDAQTHVGSPSRAATVSHLRAMPKPTFYYLDANGDGYGAGPPILVYPRDRIASVMG